jgi:hypothetical protein
MVEAMFSKHSHNRYAIHWFFGLNMTCNFLFLTLHVVAERCSIASAYFN